jgi:hypothetical protein
LLSVGGDRGRDGAGGASENFTGPHHQKCLGISSQLILYDFLQRPFFCMARRDSEFGRWGVSANYSGEPPVLVVDHSS